MADKMTFALAFCNRGFMPGELIGAALADYAFEFGFGSDQILDKKVRRSFAARIGHLYKKHPRSPKSVPEET